MKEQICEVRRVPSGYARDKRDVMLRPISPEEIKKLAYGQAWWYIGTRGAIRVRVASALKRWKRDAMRMEVSIKFGFYESTRLYSREEIQGALWTEIDWQTKYGGENGKES